MEIRCQDVSKSFGGVVALDHFSLELGGPAIIGIIGPNGAGKTTLINVLTGLVAPDAGSVLLDEQDLTGMRAQMIARLGVSRTFQELRLIWQVSVLENVLVAGQTSRNSGLIPSLFGLNRRREKDDAARAMELLGVVGLSNQVASPAGELSYGQQKLLSIGCALATGADVLLLDEPIAGLHPAVSGQVLELLCSLRSQGKLVVMVEHDIEAVRQVSDRLVVMDEGRMLAEGIPEEVLRKPEIMEAYVA